MPLAARLRLLTCVCAAVWLAACTLPANPPAQPAPRPTRTPFALGTPAPAPRATADPRVQWPPDVPAFLPAGGAIVNVSEVDTDGDGIREMLVIYALDGAGHGLVIRREGAAGRAYALGGSLPAELFRERWSGEETRLAQRREAWRELFATLNVPPLFVHLAALDLEPGTQSLQQAVEQRAA